MILKRFHSPGRSQIALHSRALVSGRSVLTEELRQANHRFDLTSPHQIQWSLATERIVWIHQEGEPHPRIQILGKCSQHLAKTPDRAAVPN